MYELYVARGKGGKLTAHTSEPKMRFGGWMAYDGDLELPNSWFPELTWDNSPIKVKFDK